MPTSCSVCGIGLVSAAIWKSWKPDRRAASGKCPHVARGLCKVHYDRWWRHGSTDALPRYRHPTNQGVCADEGCEEQATRRGWCKSDYNRHLKAGDFEPRTFRHREDILDEWVWMRDDGVMPEVAAKRLGMTYKAFEGHLYRAKKRGDPRGSRVPFAHDMRRNAA